MGRGLRQTITQTKDLPEDLVKFMQDHNAHVTNEAEFFQILREWKRSKEI